MDEPRTLGTALMAVAAVQMLIFTLGMARRSYVAVALPVFTALAAVSGLLFWVGYTMANAEPELAELDRDIGDAA